MNSKPTSLTPDEVNFPQVAFESQALTTIALLLNSFEDEVVIRALGSIIKYIEKNDKNKIEAKEIGIIDLLIPHLQNANKSIVKYTCMTTGLLASLCEIRADMRRLDVISKLLDLIGNDEHEMAINEYATLTLSYMSIDYHGRMIILKLNGIPTITKMLAFNDPDVQKNSLDILANLLQSLNTVKIFDEIGGIPSLFELLKSDFEVIQQIAFLCLTRVTNKRKRQKNFVDIGGLHVLLQFVDSKAQNEFQADALRILTNCLEDPECASFLSNHDFMPVVVELLRKAEKNELKLLCLKALFKLAKNSKTLKLMQKEELEELFVTLLSNEVPAIQAATAEIVALVAENRHWRESLHDVGVVEHLVQLLSSADNFVRLAATVALSNMTYTSNKNSKDVHLFGGLPMLIEFLHESNFELQAAAAACFTNLAINKTTREEAIHMNVMAGFINCIQSRDLILQLNTCTAIAAYICDSEARQQLLGLGIAPLVKLLSLPKPEIYLKALWIISTIGVYLDVAVAMCEHGIIHSLSQHVKWNHRGNYADLVMERIFLTHLPAKYGYTGRLAVTDHINDLFFDVGSWPWENKFYSLEEFSIAPVNSKPPILLVNFQQKTNPLKLDTPSDDSDSKSEESSNSAVFRPTRDPILLKYLDEVKEKIMPITNIRQQAKSLAEFVSEKMGGSFNNDTVHSFSPELETSHLKCKYTSNVIPIGSLSKNTFRPRALLYKALADQIGIPCSLIRGNLRRIWNEVLLPPMKTKEREIPVTESVIVDLVFSPGRLLHSGSLDANEYCDL